MLEDVEGRTPDLLGLSFEKPIVMEPAGFGVIPLAPECLEHALRPLNLLKGRSHRFAAFHSGWNAPTRAQKSGE